MTPEEEKLIVEQMAEAGTTLFKFKSNGCNCVAINMYNHMLTMNMSTCMNSFYGKVSVELQIIPGAMNRVTLYPHSNPDDNPDDSIIWFDCATAKQATGLQDFICQYNDNWSPDPDGEDNQ